MRVVIDEQVFTEQKGHGGIARYFAELISQYRGAADLGIDVVTPFRWVRNEHLIDVDPTRFRAPRLPGFLERGRVIRGLNTPYRRGGHTADAVVHHTYYLPEGLHWPAATRVCTVYDMIPEQMPELFPYGSPHAAKREYVDACHAILCISQATKDDLMRHYGAVDKPVVVTPLGVGPTFFAPARIDSRPNPYLLFVGQRFHYKNFDALLQAFSLIAADRPDLRLVCVGGAELSPEEIDRISALGLAGRVTRERVSDADLPSVYAGAECLVFPSRYEGFGLPIVEAFAAGCPVVLADMPCSLEVGGSAAQFFPPDDAQALAQIVAQLVGDRAVRARWVAQGRARAQDFTWRRTAELTRDVYRQVSRTA